MILYTKHVNMMTNEDAFFNKYETIFKEVLGDKFGKCIYSRYNTEFIRNEDGSLSRINQFIVYGSDTYLVDKLDIMKETLAFTKALIDTHKFTPVATEEGVFLMPITPISLICLFNAEYTATCWDNWMIFNEDFYDGYWIDGISNDPFVYAPCGETDEPSIAMYMPDEMRGTLTTVREGKHKIAFSFSIKEDAPEFQYPKMCKDMKRQHKKDQRRGYPFPY